MAKDNANSVSQGMITVATGVDRNGVLYLPATPQASTSSIFFLPATAPQTLNGVQNGGVSFSNGSGSVGLQYMNNPTSLAVQGVPDVGAVRQASGVSSTNGVVQTQPAWFFRQLDGCGTILSNNPVLIPSNNENQSVFKYKPQVTQAQQALLAQQLSSLSAPNLSCLSGQQSQVQKAQSKHIKASFWENMITNSSTSIDKSICFGMALTLYGTPPSRALTTNEDVAKQNKVNEAILRNTALRQKAFTTHVTKSMFESCAKPSLRPKGSASGSTVCNVFYSQNGLLQEPPRKRIKL